MNVYNEKKALEARYNADSPTSTAINVPNFIQQFILEVTPKQKERVTATYMANTVAKFMHGLAEAKEEYLAQVKNDRTTKSGAGDKAGSLGTAEDVGARLISIMTALLEQARQTPIDTPSCDQAKTVTEILNAGHSDIIDYSFTSDVLKWMAAHPYATAFHIACGILLLAPGLAVAPILAMVGFGAEGIIAGSIAARYMAIAGPIAARSCFAFLQSAATGGYGLWKVYQTVRAGIAVAQTFEIGRAIKQKERQTSAPIMFSVNEKRALIAQEDFVSDKKPISTDQDEKHGGGGGVGNPKTRDCPSCVIQ